MEILGIDFVSTYHYKPDINLPSYDGINNECDKECVICKRLLTEPEYDVIIDNKKILDNNTLLQIGKCGHVFHNECMKNWLKTSKICPCDGIKWYPCRFIDTTTKLIIK